MRDSVAKMETARAGGHTQVIAALIEVAKGFQGLQQFHTPPDPIVTATLARILTDDREALRFYLEALAQNQVLPDERSYEWRLPLAERFTGAVHIQTTANGVSNTSRCRG